MRTQTNQPQPQQERLAYRVDEFCRAAGLSRSTVYKLMSDGALRTVRVAGRRLIPADAARALLNGEAPT